MIAWLHPAALVGLLAVAGPVLVHLLRRQQARRVVVPTVRFVRHAELSSVRLRRIADPGLLAIRAAIVACAALALARPLLLNEAREAAWSDRTARVVLVDASASARPHINDAQVDAEVAGGDPATVVETADLRAGLRRAVVWLASSPPARREIVVQSDFQIGALSETDLAQVPAGIGLRLVAVGAASTPVDATALAVLDGERRLAPRLRLDDAGMSLTYEVGRAASLDGLTVHAPPGQADRVARLLRVVRAAGAVAPSPDQPIVIRFAGAATASEGAESAAGWAAGAAYRLLLAPEIRGLDLRVTPTERALVVDVNADPASLQAALIVKAALDARNDPASLHEQEPRRVDDATLLRWSRPAGPADASAWRQTDESDGRWLWALALALLIVEGIVRRSSGSAQQAREPHAA